MEKYLFNDGTNVIQEVQSSEELKSLLQSCSDPTRTRIWVFDTNEWMSYSDFAKTFNFSIAPALPAKPVVATPAVKTVNGTTVRPLPKRNTWLKKFLFFVGVIVIGLLVYNFTKIKWEDEGSVSMLAVRPNNTPAVDVDSLIHVVETQRGQSLDKVTKTNFRIRNTWPDKISLKLTADRFSNKITNRYNNIELAIDNSTGYNIDNAVVQLNVWDKVKADSFKVNRVDTFRFSNIGYVLPAKRKLSNEYKGDSISVSFYSMRSKVFNFCYAAEKESNYGNLNDRWYCKE